MSVHIHVTTKCLSLEISNRRGEIATTNGLNYYGNDAIAVPSRSCRPSARPQRRYPSHSKDLRRQLELPGTLRTTFSTNAIGRRCPTPTINGHDPPARDLRMPKQSSCEARAAFVRKPKPRSRETQPAQGSGTVIPYRRCCQQKWATPFAPLSAIQAKRSGLRPRTGSPKRRLAPPSNPPICQPDG